MFEDVCRVEVRYKCNQYSHREVHHARDEYEWANTDYLLHDCSKGTVLSRASWHDKWGPLSGSKRHLNATLDIKSGR